MERKEDIHQRGPAKEGHAKPGALKLGDENKAKPQVTQSFYTSLISPVAAMLGEEEIFWN
jgi:hypothetical protein